MLYKPGTKLFPWTWARSSTRLARSIHNTNDAGSRYKGFHLLKPNVLFVDFGFEGWGWGWGRLDRAFARSSCKRFLTILSSSDLLLFADFDFDFEGWGRGSWGNAGSTKRCANWWRRRSLAAKNWFSRTWLEWRIELTLSMTVFQTGSEPKKMVMVKASSAISSAHWHTNLATSHVWIKTSVTANAFITRTVLLVTLIQMQMKTAVLLVRKQLMESTVRLNITRVAQVAAKQLLIACKCIVTSMHKQIERMRKKLHFIIGKSQNDFCALKFQNKWTVKTKVRTSTETSYTVSCISHKMNTKCNHHSWQ